MHAVLFDLIVTEAMSVYSNQINSFTVKSVTDTSIHYLLKYTR